MVSKIISLAGVFALVPTLLHAQGRGPELPAGDGKELAQAVCATACHDGTALLMKRDGEKGWRANAERMIVQKGAQVSVRDLDILIRYLSTQLGPGAGRMQATGTLPPDALGGGAKTAQEVRLPDGPGKEVVQARCSLCHDLGRVVSVRRTDAQWKQLTQNMVERGPQANAEQIQTIVTYLTTNFRTPAN